MGPADVKQIAAFWIWPSKGRAYPRPCSCKLQYWDQKYCTLFPTLFPFSGAGDHLDLCYAQQDGLLGTLGKIKSYIIYKKKNNSSVCCLLLCVFFPWGNLMVVVIHKHPFTIFKHSKGFICIDVIHMTAV